MDDRAPPVAFLLALVVGAAFFLVTWEGGPHDYFAEAGGFAVLALGSALYMRSAKRTGAREPARQAAGAFAVGLVAAWPGWFRVEDDLLAAAALACLGLGVFHLARALHHSCKPVADTVLRGASAGAVAVAALLPLYGPIAFFDLPPAQAASAAGPHAAFAFALLALVAWRVRVVLLASPRSRRNLNPRTA